MLQLAKSLPTIALVAGEGQMPAILLKEIKANHQPIFLIAIKGSTSPDLIKENEDYMWVELTQISTVIKACKKRGVSSLIMAGRILHNKIFSLSFLKMDFTTLKLCLSLKDWRADSVLGAISTIFNKKGIKVLDSTLFLKKKLAKKGNLTHKKPSRKDQLDINLGLKLAKEMGNLDVGQTVVIKKQSVVAVEAMEGTDQCILRAGELAGEGCIVVKTSKPNQDMRFDVPTIGIQTIQKLIKIKAKGLVIEANKTLILDPEISKQANEAKMFIVAVDLSI